MAHLLVSAYFQQKAVRVQPSEAALARARVHAQQIRRRLETSFEVKRIDLIGSHAKGTAIRGSSDLDLLAVMTREEARKWARDDSSRTLINRVGNDLRLRFPLTSVRRDGQAIVVRFQQGEFAVDVVPAIFARFGAAPTYWIPDGGGAWTETSPAAQLKLLAEADAKSGGESRADHPAAEVVGGITREYLRRALHVLRSSRAAVRSQRWHDVRRIPRHRVWSAPSRELAGPN